MRSGIRRLTVLSAAALVLLAGQAGAQNLVEVRGASSAPAAC